MDSKTFKKFTKKIGWNKALSRNRLITTHFHSNIYYQGDMEQQKNKILETFCCNTWFDKEKFLFSNFGFIIISKNVLQ